MFWSCPYPRTIWGAIFSGCLVLTFLQRQFVPYLVLQMKLCLLKAGIMVFTTLLPTHSDMCASMKVHQVFQESMLTMAETHL